ncbi:molybdopterin molybdotransferase MoeA [Brachybacterium sp. EF45031]|uniref:molybdopterin molybdotransferase MoeA n=1 Tax=Brachybacterium sillae TaxID=2810536 RepID=UPI00217E8A6D|nr:gephyrin-like molybdotransferase Glp [Brachybacterium sillae]MCS6711378.1 molybdopterin molybdotransferase MoeA [Brachybacterium sillae]
MTETTPRLPLRDHQEDVAALVAGLRRVETVPLGAGAVGRCSAVDVRSRVDVPALANSQMDGFAVRREDLGGPLPVGEPAPAGAAPREHRPGTATPVMTGAPLPRGAQLVVPIEESAEGRFDLPTVTLHPTDTTPGRYVRPAGSDTHAGDLVLREGETLTPARIAHLAACGLPEVPVLEPVRVLVASTGRELTAPGSTLPPGGAYDANGPGLAAALTRAGADVVATLRAGDAPGELVAALRRALADHAVDLIVTSGGVSAGAYEPVRLAADDPGVRMSLVRVAMQPGGPQGIGRLDDTAWVALPGNPVSALLSAEVLLRPALGAAPRRVLQLPLSTEEPADSPPALEQYRRARVLPTGRVRLVGGPGSHLLGAMAQSDALVRIPVGTARVHDGDTVDTILIGDE